MNYLDYFLGGREQLLALAAVFALWLALAAVGGVLGGRRRLIEADALLGWGAVTLVFTVAGVVLDAPFAPLAWGFFGLAAAAAAALIVRDRRLVAAGALQAALVAAPLLLIAAALVPSQWDEFSHWLPAARFLFETGRLPSVDNPVTGTQMLYAYPYGWPFLQYLAGRIAGRFIENAGALLNVLLVIAFGLAAVRLAFAAAGREDVPVRGWVAAALAVLAGTLFNPTFAQKVVLTAYADTNTAVALGFAALLGLRGLALLAAGEAGQARRLAWHLGLVLAVLVNIKQVNVVLFVLLLASFAIAGLRHPAVAAGALLRCLPAAALPGLVVYAVWRYHVATALADPALFGAAEATFMPFAEWNVALIPRILLQMGVVAGKKIAFFAVMAAAVVLAGRALVRRRGPLDDVALVTGLTFLGYNAFLLLTYVGSFAAVDALRVVSFWRYNMHVGLLAVVFGAAVAGHLWQRWRPGATWSKRLGGAAVVLVVAAPLVLPYKLRIDLEAPKPLYWGVAADLKGAVPKDAALFLLDPIGTGEAAVITRYRLDRHAVPYLSAFSGTTPDRVREFTGGIRPGARLVVHSLTPETADILGLALAPGTSYLLVRGDGGGWRIERSWRHPSR